MTTDIRPKVLVAVASKHGATWEIAKRIGDVIAQHDLRAIVMGVEGYYDVADFDAVILGSAVYAGKWLKPAYDFVEHFQQSLAAKPVWLFSSGPIGDPPHPRGERAVDIDKIITQVHARAHHIFGGKLDKHTLSFGERALIAAVRAPIGDYRNWEEINTWADSIGITLNKELATEGG